MKLFYSLIYLIIIIIFPITLFEIYDRYISEKEIKIDGANLWKNYTPEELDIKTSSFHSRSGKNCMEKIIPTWHHKIGFQDKIVNFKCLKNHFSQDTFNIAFFGGSVMESTYYKNYLTSIDWLVIQDNKKIHSINFAQSGSRLSNELGSFIIMLKHLKPDLAIFLDGANEFNSIKYNNGKADEDFYWSVWAKKRIEDPYKIYLDKLIEKSATARVILINLLNYKPSNHIQSKKLETETILDAANDYIHYNKITQTICEEYKIKCLFFLQPIIYKTVINDELTTKLKSKFLGFYPNNDKIYNEGYDRILQTKNIINLSNILSNIKYAFLDEMHVNKNGSHIIAKEIKNKVNEIIVQE